MNIKTLLFFITLLPTAIQADDIYKCKDEKGLIKFSSYKCSSNDTLLSKAEYSHKPDSCQKKCDRKLSGCRATGTIENLCRDSFTICNIECVDPERAYYLQKEINQQRRAERVRREAAKLAAIKAANPASYKSDVNDADLSETEQQNPRAGDVLIDSGGIVINSRTGNVYTKSGAGVINNRTGQFYPKSGNGYIGNEGQYLPSTGP